MVASFIETPDGSLLGCRGAIVAAVTILAFIIIYKNNKKRAITKRSRCFSLEGLLHFSLYEILSATKNFNLESFIGDEGSGEVYGGLIDNGERTVAIKRLSRNPPLEALEFWNEVKALYKLRHANLVSLIGYCDESQETILVYKFTPLGTLADNLYINNSLSWEQRLRICIGVARGLDYLHTGSDHGVIIHGHLKSSNILLDEKFEAKISDFGLTKTPEIMQLPTNHLLTEKSDVYSFGVVLFEVLYGRAEANSRDTENQPEFISLARNLFHDGHIDQFVDLRINRQISPKCLNKFVEISEKCLHDDPKKRPSMVQLVADLELLLDDHVVGRKYAKMVQDRDSQNFDAPDIVAQKISSWGSATAAQPNVLDSASSSFPVEPSHSNKELMFPDGLGLCFSISEIITATGNFSNDNILYNGLYKIYGGGYLRHSKASSIIYRGKYMSGIPKLKELFRLPHPNLASMVGYCYMDGDMIIVYEYEDRGILLQHLNCTWYNRLNICIGAATALKCLHTLRIIHGGISPTTILLDSNFGAKVATFGSISSQLTARNAGTLEQLPPDFSDSTKMTEKTDVYLFGLLLLTVLCGKKTAYSGGYPLHLPSKVRKAIKKNTLYQITDLNLQDVAEKCLSNFLEVALSCLSPMQVDRPSMDTVLEGLKKAQALQI